MMKEMKRAIDLKQLLLRKVKSLIANSARGHDSLLLQGRIASMHVRTMRSIDSLEEIEFRVFSQFGEDGIIEWLVQLLDLPPHLQSFVEFGVEKYKEANTRFLLENRNWRGLIMDGDPALREELKRDPVFWKHSLAVESAFITRENINDLIFRAGFSGDIGLLCIDLDGNDYWIWEVLSVVRPVILISEYNAVFGDLHSISTPYDPQFLRERAHFSHLYFGASIQALRHLAAKKGYTFVGTTSAGNDAFFVRNDYAPRVIAEIRNVVAHCSRTRESRDQTGQLSYVGGRKRFDLIADLPVIQVQTGNRVNLKDLGEVYSQDWI